MSDDGSVPRDCVIHVLTAIDSISTKIDGHDVTVVRDGIPEVTTLPDNVPRRMLHRFSKKYDINIEYFYHPEMVVRGNTAKH